QPVLLLPLGFRCRSPGLHDHHLPHRHPAPVQQAVPSRRGRAQDQRRGPRQEAELSPPRAVRH
ncbi:hypothetical protein BN1723_020077, partial [Verticillium longisporum]